MQAPAQGKLPGSSAGGAAAAAGSSGRANGVALPAAVKPEDKAKEQGNAALKQGDYDQVGPMLRLQMLQYHCMPLLMLSSQVAAVALHVTAKRCQIYCVVPSSAAAAVSLSRYLDCLCISRP